jgi:hypothetical protein
MVFQSWLEEGVSSEMNRKSWRCEAERRKRKKEERKNKKLTVPVVQAGKVEMYTNSRVIKELAICLFF